MNKQTNITILLDSELKKKFSQLCKDEDTTISQDLRAYIKQRLQKSAQKNLALK